MDLKLSTRQVNDVTIIDAAGRITRGDAVDSIRKTLADLVRAGHTKVLANLKDVEFIDSGGIGVLVAAVTQVKCGRCGSIYSNLLADKCPKCGESVKNTEMEADSDSDEGAWKPPWGEFKLLFPNKKVEDLLRITKLYTAFRIYHDETIAVDSF